MTDIRFEGVGKVYPDGTRAVSDLNLNIGEGEFTVLVGPSGCGKTTALRMIAGLEEVSEGRIWIGGDEVNDVEPRKRDVAMVFQNYALYPHMTVFDNIAFPLQNRRMPKPEVRSRVEHAASVLGLTELLQRRPKTLSGGQRQRVAMGRAIVRQPRAFLMDEPLSNLDANLRVQMRAEIARLQRDLAVTTVYVTHDQVEAMTMGSRIAVMRKGVLQHEGPPQDLYDRPANLFVATFIGSPAMNLMRARLESIDGRLTCFVGDQQFELAAELLRAKPHLEAYRGRDVALGVRPEHIGPTVAGRPQLRGVVQLVESLGSERLVHVEIAAEPVLTDEILELKRDIDEAAVQTLQQGHDEHKVLLIARFSPEATTSAGEPVAICLNAQRLHFFDLTTGEALH